MMTIVDFSTSLAFVAGLSLALVAAKSASAFYERLRSGVFLLESDLKRIFESCRCSLPDEETIRGYDIDDESKNALIKTRKEFIEDSKLLEIKTRYISKRKTEHMCLSSACLFIFLISATNILFLGFKETWFIQTSIGWLNIFGSAYLLLSWSIGDYFGRSNEVISRFYKSAVIERRSKLKKFDLFALWFIKQLDISTLRRTIFYFLLFVICSVLLCIKRRTPDDMLNYVIEVDTSYCVIPFLVFHVLSYLNFIVFFLIAYVRCYNIKRSVRKICLNSKSYKRILECKKSMDSIEKEKEKMKRIIESVSIDNK